MSLTATKSRTKHFSECCFSFPSVLSTTEEGSEEVEAVGGTMTRDPCRLLGGNMGTTWRHRGYIRTIEGL